MNPEHEKAVFADPRGVRRRALQLGTLSGVFLLLGAAGYFIWGLLIGPQLRLPAIVRNYHEQLRALPPAKIPPLDARDNWMRILNANKEFAPRPPRPEATGVVLGYVSSDDASSLNSLERHADQLTHVATDWFSLTGVEGTLREEQNDKTRLLCVRKGLGFLPILRNLDGNVWQPEAVEELARSSPQERSLFLDKLISRMPPGSTGLLVEWSEVDPTYKQETTQLIKDFADHLHAAGKELWFTVPTGNDFDSFDLDAISDSADRLVAVLYDQNSDPDDPGPLADSAWFQGWLKTLMSYGDPDQWVIGLGTYGYDWRKDNNTVQTIGYADAMARAAQAEVDPSLVDSSLDSPHFDYLEGEDQNQEHEVWFLDAISFFNEWHEAAAYHPGGMALFSLGQEDPAIWDLLRGNATKAPDPKDLAALSAISLDDQIASTGSGDFITVGEDPTPGARLVSTNAQGQLFERYTKFPIPANITRQGDPGTHKVALTFDDGPDPTWTPRILKILEQRNVPATFFVLGSQVQQYPDLLEREAREGYEVGNHTYTHQNIAEESDEQIELELNATTRLIEAVTGHSTAYFRPPFGIDDGTPSDPSEIRALRVVRDLGYLTVAESIDTSDWERPAPSVIVDRVKRQRAAGGSVILMHDSGGDRSSTVAALPEIIDYLQSRGDTIVPLSEIINLPRETVMPTLREEDQPLSTRYVYGGFAVMRFLENAAWTLLMVVTLLALLRVTFLGICAFRHRKRESLQPPEEPLTYPPISVLIAAYNEERVIASTIRHLLDADYPAPIEIVVVDDGSKDQTASIVTAIAAVESRVRLIRQPNGGKSAALNRALAAAGNETLVMIDADTLVATDGLRKLVAPLADPEVGAVSGAIRVGNTRRWLGKFQDLEYVAAFEIDRRAQDFLGCILVAPGALSAFRREAVDQAGALTNDTLAEDTDLTLQLHRLGWKVVFAPKAFADTEAPEHVKALLSQRFRWAYGTLQCLWKHGEILFAPGHGWLGWFALPSVWIFQIAVVAVTPILDIMVLWSLWLGRGSAIWPYFVASLLLDVALSIIALLLAGRAIQSAWKAIPMRLLYRPLLGYVVWKCLWKALAGSWVRWAKLERTAGAIAQKANNPDKTVSMP